MFPPPEGPLGSINRDRLPQTGMLRFGRPSHVWIAKCIACGRKSLLPTERILKRFDERVPLGPAALQLKCAGCGKIGADAYPESIRISGVSCCDRFAQGAE